MMHQWGPMSSIVHVVSLSVYACTACDLLFCVFDI